MCSILCYNVCQWARRLPKPRPLLYGPYDDELMTIDATRAFAAERGYAPDFSESRLHHDIYLSDPRKCAPEKLKTVILHLIKLI